MIEELVKAAILGTVQGITEFLPVSSTGHLILTQRLLGVDEDTYGLSFDASIHLGTLVALLAFFGMRWVRLLGRGIGAVRDRSFADPEGRLAWLIVLGTIPAAIIGFLFAGTIEDAFRSPALVATMLIAFSGVFVLAEAVSKRVRTTADLTWVDALFVGLFQAIALIPGVSRSGATISAGLFRNVDRAEAATFAFLLSAPIIAGAGMVQAVDVIGDFRDGTLGGDDAAFFLTGMTFAGVVGYVSIAFLLRFLTTNSLRPFVFYRITIGLLVYAVLIAQWAG